MNSFAPLSGLTFTKMHGLGNDFVVVDARLPGPRVTPALAQSLGDRNRGVGFDQLAEIRASDRADLRLDFWNADGTLSGACGNATRCVAARVMDQKGTDSLRIETAAGVLQALRRDDGRISVNMGPPQRGWAEIPLARDVDPLALPLAGVPAAIGMGNPHCIHVVSDADAIALDEIGPLIEHDPLFPQRTNVEFVQVRADGSLRLRVWERGAGVTLACGSGACATAVATHLLGLTPPAVEIEMDGGWLSIDWRDDGVWMTGPTAHVFDGTLAPAWIEAMA
ncbi:diaminopimelate epimerase [Meridianimarinicoccus roseus]|uniref:Diaminopimelate epimerase n=1 Tax=Meridianimarinicoccus roseus TaxID=2072018 RepID=A0A2V2L685_9RHOB|nr:diaminopimelate epimerase [Meridianimarinicoccus roseus]PWR00912.1 diaminopimelate epimerase [Meridianimarinicoccus roseus]